MNDDFKMDGGAFDSGWVERDTDQVYVSVSERFVMLPLLVHYDSRIRSQQKELYQELRVFAFQKNYCFPGEETLGKRLGCTSRTVRNNLAKLVEVGLVIRKRRPNQTSLYFLPSVHEIYVESLRPFKLMDWVLKSLNERGIVSSPDDMAIIQAGIERDKGETVQEIKKYQAKKRAEAGASRTSRAAAAVGNASEQAAIAIQRAKESRARKIPGAKVKINPGDGAADRPLSVKDLHALYLEHYPSEAKWQGKEWGIAKRLMAQFGPDKTIYCVYWVLTNWEKVLVSNGLQGPPALQRVAHWAKTWFDQIDGDEKGKTSLDKTMMTPRQRSLAQGECNNDDSASDKKGKISFGFTGEEIVV